MNIIYRLGFLRSRDDCQPSAVELEEREASIMPFQFREKSVPSLSTLLMSHSLPCELLKLKWYLKFFS